MFSHRMVLRFLVLMIAGPLVMTGCFGKTQPQDTKAPVIENKLGIIDMNKIVKAHPRYNEYQTLQLQINALNYQLEAKAQLAAPEALLNQPSEFQESETAGGLSKSSQVGSDVKLAKKREQLNDQYNAQAAKAKQSAAAQLEAYRTELEKEYVLPLFNLKLKQTASLSQSDAAAVQAEIEKIKIEQQQKYAAKAALLESQMNQLVAAEYEHLQAEMLAYQKELNKEAVAVKPAESAVQDSWSPLPIENDSADQVKLTEQLSALQQKQALLEQQILEDIQNKTGQIAAEKGLDTVITNIKVNIRALDITELVIAGLKK
ncbi:MAG: hypothetical protein LLG02_12130 [Pelosinus sp.]|nr:hypothetical protein [Pelosinus sp.]